MWTERAMERPKTLWLLNYKKCFGFCLIKKSPSIGDNDQDSVLRGTCDGLTALSLWHTVSGCDKVIQWTNAVVFRLDEIVAPPFFICRYPTSTVSTMISNIKQTPSRPSCCRVFSLVYITRFPSTSTRPAAKSPSCLRPWPLLSQPVTLHHQHHPL